MRVQSRSDCWMEVILTYRDQVTVVLQHHLSVKSSLNRVQEFPFFLGEFYGHIPKCQQVLKRNKYFTTRKCGEL